MYGNQPPSTGSPYGAPQPVLGQTPGGRTRVMLVNVDPMSMAKIFAISGAIGGFIVGLMVLVFGSMFAGIMATAGNGARGANPAAVMAGAGLASMIIYPIIYAIGGFIGGLIYGFLYNMASKWVGGIVYETENTY